MIIIIKGGRITIGIYFRAFASSREGPVLIVRVVKAETNTNLLASLGEVFHRVTSEGSCIHDIEFICLGVIHRKAIMMLTGDDDVFHARILGELSNGLRVEINRVKIIGQFPIFRNGNTSHVGVHDPLANAVVSLTIHLVTQVGIQTPVDKHRIVAIIKELPSLSISRAEFDYGITP